MNADIYATWLQSLGHKVIRTQSSYWFDQARGVFQAFPYHWIIKPEESELNTLLKSHKALGLRYSTPVDSPVGYISYHNVYTRAAYDLDDLKATARNKVRQGLRQCVVEPISMRTLAVDGWRLYNDTLDRQRRTSPIDQKSWEKRCLVAGDLPGFEAWGAFVNGNLGAALFAFQLDDWYHILFQQSSREFLSARVNNALTFVVTKMALERPGIRAIHYGLHSLDAPDTIDEFKFNMGYMSYPVRQRIVYNPMLKPFASPVLLAVAEKMPGFIQKQAFFSKAKGMLHYYLQGKLPLDAQPWPDCLANQKDAILAGLHPLG